MTCHRCGEVLINGGLHLCPSAAFRVRSVPTFDPGLTEIVDAPPPWALELSAKLDEVLGLLRKDLNR